MESANQSAQAHSWRDHVHQLERRRVVRLTTVGRKSGAPRTVKVWFVFLAPDVIAVQHVRHPTPNWYRNIVHNPQVVVDFGELALEGRAEPVTDRNDIGAILRKIRAKYGFLAWLLQLWGTGDAVAARVRLIGGAEKEPVDTTKIGNKNK